MKDYTTELHQSNYNAIVARRVADKLQGEIESGDTALRKARQTGGALPDMATKEQKQKHVDDELATAKRMEENKIRKASEILGMSGVPVKNRDNKAKTDGLKPVMKVEYETIRANPGDEVQAKILTDALVSVVRCMTRCRAGRYIWTPSTGIVSHGTVIGTRRQPVMITLAGLADFISHDAQK
eukprot:COSAG01_NODE_2936_length_6828_cov_20.818992_7_plen_183_part_00